MAKKMPSAAKAHTRALDEAGKRLKSDALAFGIAGVHGSRQQIIDQAGDLFESVARILEMRKVDIEEVKKAFLSRTK